MEPTGQQSSEICIGCGYQLLGLPAARCPECGREFDRAKPHTRARGRIGAWAARHSERPPGILDLVLTMLAAGATLYAFMPPGRFDGPLGLGVAAWVLAGGLWVLRVGERLASRAYGDRHSGVPRRRFWPPAAVLPAVAVATAVLVARDVPLRTGFWLGREAFEQIPPGPLVAGLSRRAGPYSLRERYTDWLGCSWFNVEGDSGADRRCFVRVPAASLPYMHRHVNFPRDWQRLSPTWYVFSRRKD